MLGDGERLPCDDVSGHLIGLGSLLTDSRLKFV